MSAGHQVSSYYSSLRTLRKLSLLALLHFIADYPCPCQDSDEEGKGNDEEKPTEAALATREATHQKRYVKFSAGFVPL